MDPLVGGHGGGGVGIGVIGGSILGPLDQCEHEHRAEVARQESQHTGAQVDPGRLADLVAQQPEPMLLVTAFRRGQCEQDVPLLTRAPLREIAVDRGLRALVGQMPTPPAQIGTSRA